ncbi:permease [Natroniella sulfidigena]|uniref:permease n=1 Tax=Natroniella sulfidigena TaxID=723921 RepID=UPI00200B8B68|nr:permease [Natroniella sulfidigena]MCK8818022.1 permease [Natroniella sulfidigena]
MAFYLLPLFILSTFFVGLIQEYLSPERIKRSLCNRNTVMSHFLASTFGSLTPFRAPSTITLLVRMLKDGVPFGSSMSFLLASPLINYVAIILLSILFGWEVTVVYVIATLIATMIGGIILEKMGLEEHLKEVTAVGERKLPHREELTTANKFEFFKSKTKSVLRFALLFFKDFFPFLMAGMIIGSLLYGFVPENFITWIVGLDNPLAVPLAALIGAPIYLSLEAMIPIAFTLFQMGMGLGAAIALIIGGSGISISNFIILAKLFERKLLVAYGISIIITATIIGYLFNSLV